MLEVSQKYLFLGGVLFIISNVFLLLFIDNVSLVNIFEEILFTSSLKEILNRVLYTLVVCVAGLLICKFIGIYLHFKRLTMFKKLQETLNGRGIDMTNVSPESAEALMSNVFGDSVVNERFSQGHKMSHMSHVMTHMANEKQDTFDLANLLLDKQFMLKVSQTQQELRTHIINISSGVDVKLKKSELLTLMQQTGRSEEQLLKDYPNLKIEDQSDKVQQNGQGTDQTEEKQSDNEISLNILSIVDSKFLLENLLCHVNVSKTLLGLKVDVENLSIEILSTRVCKAVLGVLVKVKSDIKDQDKLVNCVALLHKIVIAHDDLTDHQWKNFTKLAQSFNIADITTKQSLSDDSVSPEVIIDESLIIDDTNSDSVVKQYLSDDEDEFIRRTIENCQALRTECNIHSIVLSKPIDFDDIGKTNLEKLANIALQQKNQYKHEKKYEELEALLIKVIAAMWFI